MLVAVKSSHVVVLWWRTVCPLVGHPHACGHTLGGRVFGVDDRDDLGQSGLEGGGRRRHLDHPSTLFETLSGEVASHVEQVVCDVVRPMMQQCCLTEFEVSEGHQS